jgi:hypothetical protein
MVGFKEVTLSFPVNSLQIINYTISNYLYYNLYFPQITSDSQLGTEINLVKTNFAQPNTTASSGNSGLLYIGTQGSNVFYSSNVLSPLSYYVMNSNTCYAKFIAMKHKNGTYGWLEIDSISSPCVNRTLTIGATANGDILGASLQFSDYTYGTSVCSLYSSAANNAFQFDVNSSYCYNGFIFSNNGSQILKIDSNGSIYNNNNGSGSYYCGGSSNYVLRMSATTLNGYIDYYSTLYFRNLSSVGPNLSGNGASISSNGAYNTFSDQSLKKNFQALNYGLNEIMRLASFKFNYINEKDTDTKSLGLIAQHVEEVIPELVSKSDDDKYMMNYMGLIPVLINAIQEQQKMILDLQTQVKKLLKK